MTDQLPSWRAYQNEAADFFRGLGMTAETDCRLQGARASHDVDVVVRGQYIGFDVLWVIECKEWRTPISKLHVLALREIVSDVGADRGILLAEKGFQPGAREAASLTNVDLTSLASTRHQTRDLVATTRLRDLEERAERCRDRYWTIDKEERIALSLRPDVGVGGYSAIHVIDGVIGALDGAFRGSFPIEPPTEPIRALSVMALGFVGATTPQELLRQLEPHIQDLERRLDAAGR